MLRVSVLVVVAVCVLSAACVPLARQQECIDAEACDLAFERPFGDFGADDPVFGDVGTCWQNAETSKTCTDACSKFIDEQRAVGEAQGNQAIVDACGGVEEEDSGDE